MIQPDHELLDAEDRLMAKGQAYNELLNLPSTDHNAVADARDAYQAALRDLEYLRHRNRTR